MGYRQAKMLEDINGDLIPQYWDVAEQKFKPLTNDPQDVRLISNIKRVYRGTFTLDDNSNIRIDPILIDGFNYFTLAIRVSKDVNWIALHRFYDVEEDQALIRRGADYIETLRGESDLISDKKPLLTNYLQLRISNQSDLENTFYVYIYGHLI